MPFTQDYLQKMIDFLHHSTSTYRQFIQKHLWSIVAILYLLSHLEASIRALIGYPTQVHPFAYQNPSNLACQSSFLLVPFPPGEALLPNWFLQEMLPQNQGHILRSKVALKSRTLFSSCVSLRASFLIELDSSLLC